MYIELSVYKIILHPLKKNTFAALEKIRGSGFVFLFTFHALVAALSAWKSTPESSSLGLCEKALGVTLRVPLQTMLAFGLHIYPLAARSVGSKLCESPFICSRIISVTYVHNLQRTTPTAFSRFSSVLRELCLPVLTCHRAAHDPQQFVYSTTRGQRCHNFILNGWMCQLDAAFKCASLTSKDGR